MGSIDSVLVVIDRESDVLGVAQKACMLARHFGACLELFACDSEHVAALSDETAQAARMESCLADQRRFLRSLRCAIAADDLDIAVSVGCEQPRHSGILRKVSECRPDLVMRALVRNEDRRRASILQSDEWQLARACPAPLLFTRGLPWRPAPRIAGCLPEDEVAPALRAAVQEHCERLANGCRGEARMLPTMGQRVERTDLMVLPAPHQREPARRRNAIEQFIETMECDFLLVPPPVAAAPVVQAS